MARHLAVAVAVSAALAATVAGVASAGDDGRDARNTVRDRLTGYQEDPTALSTTGQGQLRIQINERAQEISYRLAYAGLEGAVTQAHLHFSGVAQSGGISVWLCKTDQQTAPAGTQTCPAAPATISGTIRPADVVGPPGQGIAAGEFNELVAAIRAGKVYANVHSTLYPGGEIRAQLGGDHR